MNKRQSLGKIGESIACKFLQKNSYRILERNWRHSHSEIDIIAEKEDTIVAIEVKSRLKFFEDPIYSVSDHQLDRLAEASEAYLIKNSIDCNSRIDLIAIELSPTHQILRHIVDIY